MPPDLKAATLTEMRVGFRPMSKDGLPLLGQPPSAPGLIIATGLGRCGLTVVPYVGRLAAKFALGGTPELDIASLDPERPMTPPTNGFQPS
jgi:D-amino-acid dehydrogenase